MNAFISWMTSTYPRVTMLWKHQLLGFSIQFPGFFFAHQTVFSPIHLRSLQASPTLLLVLLWRWEGRVLGWGHRCLLFRPAKPNGIPGGHVDDWECHGCGRTPSGPRPQLVRTFDRLPESHAHSSFLSNFFHSLLQNTRLKTFPASISGKAGQMLFL